MYKQTNTTFKAYVPVLCSHHKLHSNTKKQNLAFWDIWMIIFSFVKLAFELSTVHMQRHSFSTHDFRLDTKQLIEYDGTATSE